MTASALVRSPVCSMSSGSRRASKPVAGNTRRSGPCCATPPINAQPASASHRPRHGNASPGRYACVAVLRRVTVHTMSGRRTSGSPFQCRRSSMSRPSPSLRNLEANKTHAPHRTILLSVVQGLVCCANCGYALYRTSTRSSARTIHYYRCLGSDAWRRLGGPICHNRPIRQDLLDRVAWTEIVKVLEEPGLIQSEPDRWAGGRPPHRSDKASRRWASARSRSSSKEHRAPAHRLPRRPSFA